MCACPGNEWVVELTAGQSVVLDYGLCMFNDRRAVDLDRGIDVKNNGRYMYTIHNALGYPEKVNFHSQTNRLMYMYLFPP